jgi:predicted O-methyltransferase YrrM
MSSPILDAVYKNTPFTSNLVKTIATSMKGNTFHHHYHILYTLRSLIDKDVATYTEIGTFNGGSLCLMLQHPSPVKCISIDPFHLDRTNLSIVQDNISKFNTHTYDIELTKKFSTDATLIADLRNREFKTDILFIDGDHRYNAVVHDFNAFSEFVASGGFIVFDDYHDAEHSPEVKPAVDFIVKNIIDKKLPFEIIGSPPNYYNVYPSELKHLNEFIIRKYSD